jgi:hypothetical protein
MGRDPHKGEKRRKELDRMKKQEEKRNKRLNKGNVPAQAENAGSENAANTTEPTSTE